MISSLLLILFLVFLEGILSFDNALALAAMVKHLPPLQQRKALTYGIFGAYIFRFASLFLVVHIFENPWLRIVGGMYLLWVATNGLLAKDESDDENAKSITPNLWRTIALVEFTDIIFSLDSILASAAVSQVFWIILAGGIIGIFMMRFVSGLFIRLMDIFPRLERAAFLLVLWMGLKLCSEGCLDLTFDSPSPQTFAFWTLMGLSLLFGFSKRTI